MGEAVHLREADGWLPVKDLCRRHGFSEASYYLWRSKFGGLSVPDTKRLKALETENTRLKKLLAESLLEPAQRTRRHNRDGFGGGVIDDRQTLQDAALGRAIEDEIGRPERAQRPTGADRRADERIGPVVSTATGSECGVAGSSRWPSDIDATAPA